MPPITVRDIPRPTAKIGEAHPIWREYNVQCDLCGDRGPHRIIQPNVKQSGHALRECLCGLRFFDPRISLARIILDLGSLDAGAVASDRSFYKGTSMPHADKPGFDAEWQKNFNRQYYARHYDKLKSLLHMPHPRVLDVGCGVGWGLKTAIERGAAKTSVGVDLNATSVRHARNGHKLDVRHHPFLWTPPNIGPFDAIMCNDYLEHSYTPFSDLRLMRRLVRAGAVLFLKTFDDDLNNKNAQCMTQPPWHAHHFQAGLLRAMLLRAGWKTLEHWVSSDVMINYYCTTAGV